jgi:hypothetical protein
MYRSHNCDMSSVSWCSCVTTWLKPLSPTSRLSWGRWNQVTQDGDRASLSSIAKTSPGCRGLIRPRSERLPTWTTWDVGFKTLCKSSMESVWRVDQIFPCRIYIDSNHRDSWIWVTAWLYFNTCIATFVCLSIGLCLLILISLAYLLKLIYL